MHERVSRQVRLKSRPSGIPQAEHFEIVEVPVPEPSDGQVLVRNIYVSVDPAMRGWVSAVANYSEPVAVGAVMRSLAVGRVEESRNSDFHPGDYLTGMFGWQDYAVVDAGAIERKVGDSGVPVSTSLGVLGLNGLTAYFALLDLGQPQAGETVVVSTAAGAVGSCAGQIAKIKGCRTVGIAGGPDKVRICSEDFRYDSAVDYKADDFESALDAACHGGVDIYFDNTAGPISDSVMRRLKVGARMVPRRRGSLCGVDEEVVPVLYVEDAGRAVAWYRRLGFEKEWEHQFEPGFPWFVSVERGRVRLYLSEHKGDARPNTVIHLYVNDIDAVSKEFGIPVDEEGLAGRECDFEDPDGNRLRVATRRS